MKEKLHYGVIPLRTVGSFRGEIPRIKKSDGYYKKYFGYTHHGEHAYQRAVEWVEKTGIEEWGKDKWNKIKNGHLHMMRSEQHSVCVYLGHSKSKSTGELYPSWVVGWRDPVTRKNKTQWFGRRQYITLDNAKVYADMFAVKKRAELLGEPIPQFYINQFEKLEKASL